MSLRDFLEFLSGNPLLVLFYFLSVLLTSWLAGMLGKDEGHISPWKYLYSALIFMVCIPGIFALTLIIYLVTFENLSILDINLITQVLPVIFMVLTLLLIRKNVNLDLIPGFDRIPGLLVMIATLMVIMWICEKTRFIVFSYVPFYYVLIIIIILLIALRYGWVLASGKSKLRQEVPEDY